MLPKYRGAVYTHPTNLTLVALEIIWVFLKGLRKESCRAVWCTRETACGASAPSSSARAAQRLRTSHRGRLYCLLPTPAVCSVLFSVNPATLFYKFSKYSTPHLSLWPPQRDPSKGMWVGRKKGVNSSTLISFCPYHNDMWVLWDYTDRMILFCALPTLEEVLGTPSPTALSWMKWEGVREVQGPV